MSTREMRIWRELFRTREYHYVLHIWREMLTDRRGISVSRYPNEELSKDWNGKRVTSWILKSGF